MTQDTRKDRRAKIVSLNVRYKSATVDEFIDNHSHDVSKGGLFIKTSSPFPPGTLLKFEIRIAGDKAVIAGVGRVVWKRETSQAGPEVPAGMGVKFIKIDDASRAVIDKLVDSRGEGRNAYDEGVGDAAAQEGGAVPPAAPSQPQVAPPAQAAIVAKPVVPVGLSSLAGAAKEQKPPAAAAQPTPAPPVAAPFRPAPSASKIPAAAGKATMMGLGGIQDAIATATAAKTAAKSAVGPAAGRPASDDLRTRATPSARKSPPAPASSVPSTSPMFPKTNSEADMPPKGEQTVMKQAAELLEEALLGAGGSMEEIGQNPLFDLAKKDSGPATTKDKVAAPTPRGLGPSEKVEVEAEAEAAKAPAAELPPAEPAPTLVSAAPAPVPPAQLEATARSATHDDPPLAAKDRPAPVKARPISDRPAASAMLLDEEAPKNKWLLPVVGLAAAGVLGFFAYSQLYAPESDTPPMPTPPASVSTVAAPPPVSAAPAASAVPSASAAPETPSASASTSLPAAPASASAAVPEATAPRAAPPAAVVKPPAPVAPWRPPPPKPKPPPADTSNKPAEGPSTAPPPAPADTTAPPATAAPTAAETSAPAPKPAPKPKPSTTKKPEDDNPY